MKKIVVFLCLIMSVVLISPVSANEAAFDQFMKQVAKEFGDQKPEVLVKTNKEVILIFALAKTMKKIRFIKSTGHVEVKEIKKFDDSRQSPFHQDPSDRLKEAIALYESM